MNKEREGGRGNKSWNDKMTEERGRMDGGMEGENHEAITEVGQHCLLITNTPKEA